jgi:DNA-binding beta-propeller fold protein YncE
MGAMRRMAGRRLLAVGGVTGMAIAAWSGATAAAAGPASPARAASVSGGAQLWVSRYDGPEHLIDFATAAAVSPDGGTVFVTGPSVGGASEEWDYATVAYDAATGAQLWVSRYDGPVDGTDGPAAVAVSPGGGTVFVTGRSVGVKGTATTEDRYDYATVAYNSATGAQLWVARYKGHDTGVFGYGSEATALAVSPDGGTLYVTGSNGSCCGTAGRYLQDYVTIAYDAATGARRWLARYNGPASGDDVPRSVTVSPDGHTVYVTGASAGKTSGTDYATVAYDAATGAQRWASRYNGPANNNDKANMVTAAPGGRTVYVTGTSGRNAASDFATVAYNAATGAQRWVSRYNGPASLGDGGKALAITPDGRTVIVTGYSNGVGSGPDYATIAYNAATGARQWTRRYNGPGNARDSSQAIGVTPDGRKVIVAGRSYGATNPDDYATIAYNTATGAQLWVSRYNGPGNSTDEAFALAVSPDGSAVYVTGLSYGTNFNVDFATVAYKT